ncbi:unnamed protein product [Urochloa humidicola]
MALAAKKYHDASLRPPRHDPPADSHRPASCLLDFTAYIADRTNGTTASCEARGGRMLQVTFFFVDPPGVSHLCVCCPGLPPTEFACEPTVVATEADLVLIRVVFGPYDNAFNLEMHDLYIYKADGESAPALRQVPHPTPFIFFQDHQLGLLTRYEEEADLYYIAALHNKDGRHRLLRRTPSAQRGPFKIYLFSSNTGHWTAKPALLDQQHHGELRRFISTKVVTVGGQGGAITWIDLWRGLLQCNVLDEIPKLHYVPLPPPLVPKNIFSGSPWLSRDVAVIQGRVKYVELQVRIWPGTDSNRHYITDGWMAVVWSRAAANPWEDNWHEDSKIDSDHVSADPLLLDRLPKLQDIRGRPEPTLQRLHVGQPTLSLHDDSVVYLMAKVADWEDDAWVLAVDMAKGILQQVAQFSAERTLGISFSFVHSRISSHVNMDPGSRKQDGELLNKLPVIVKCEHGMTSESTTEHCKNHPTASGMFKTEIDMAASEQVHAGKAIDAKTRSPVTEVQQNRIFNAFIKYRLRTGIGAITLASGLCAGMVTSPTLSISLFSLFLAGMSMILQSMMSGHSDKRQRDDEAMCGRELLHEFNVVLARVGELLTKRPVIGERERSMISKRATDHRRNLPSGTFKTEIDIATSQKVYVDKARPHLDLDLAGDSYQPYPFYPWPGSSGQAPSKLALDAKTSSPVTEVPQSSIFGAYTEDRHVIILLLISLVIWGLFVGPDTLVTRIMSVTLAMMFLAGMHWIITNSANMSSPVTEVQQSSIFRACTEDRFVTLLLMGVIVIFLAVSGLLMGVGTLVNLTMDVTLVMLFLAYLSILVTEVQQNRSSEKFNRSQRRSQKSSHSHRSSQKSSHRFSTGFCAILLSASMLFAGEVTSPTLSISLFTLFLAGVLTISSDKTVQSIISRHR